MFQIKEYRLPHEGTTPGAPGHKKQVFPAGTKVWCIVYGTLMFHSVYLNEETAAKVAKALQATAEGTARRSIPLKTLVEWNFSSRFPRKVART